MESKWEDQNNWVKEISFETIKKKKKNRGFLGGSVVNKLPANAGDAGSIPGLGRSSGEGNGYPFQYSCLENPRDRGAWQATVHGLPKELDMT